MIKTASCKYNTGCAHHMGWSVEADLVRSQSKMRNQTESHSEWNPTIEKTA